MRRTGRVAARGARHGIRRPAPDARHASETTAKNPTHTIMALAARTAGHIAERLQKGEL